MKKISLLILAVILLLASVPAEAEVYTFVPIYMVTGVVNDHPSAPAEGNKIVIYRSLEELNAGIYAYDYVGTAGSLGIANRYWINASNTILPFTVGETYKVAVVQDANGYGAGPVEVTISGNGYDVVPTMTMAYGAGIGTPPALAVANPPVVKSIKFGNRLYQKALIEKGEKFYTSPNPKISAVIEGVGTSGIDRSNVMVIVNEGTANSRAYNVSASQITKTVYAEGTTDVIKSLSIDYSIPENEPLPEDQESQITIRAWDAAHTVSTSEVCQVTVLGGPVRIVDIPLTFPSPFSITRHGTVTIQYTLSKDAEIQIIFADISGQRIKNFIFPKGTEGGSAGLNKVTWDGRTDRGTLAGNGIYVGTIIAREHAKKLGSVKLTVVD